MKQDMSNQKHILVISQYFYPEQFRINDICQEWVKRGYKVTVLTGIPNYPQGKFYEGYGIHTKRKETWKEIEIIRIPIVPRGSRAIGLALNYLSFVITGFLWKIGTKVKADYVYIYEVSPMTQALVGVWYAKKNKIPCYLYVTDLWPENVEIVTGIHNKTIIGSISKMVDYIYRNCNQIFTSSQSFVDKIEKRDINKNKIHFWPQYAEDFYRPISSIKCEKINIPQDEILNLVFAGNIGYAQGLGCLVEAAYELKQEKILARFNMIGDGRYRNELIESIKEKKLEEYFNFIEKQPAEKIPEYMSMSDVAIISLAESEVFAMTIPAKTQSCLACGMPILVIADGEVQTIIKEGKCGFVGASGDVPALVNNIRKFLDMDKKMIEEMGERSLQISNEKYDKQNLLDYMDGFLGEK